MKKILILSSIVLLSALSSHAQEIEENKFYNLKADFPHVMGLEEETNELSIERKAKIKILKIEDSEDGKDKIYYFRPEKNYSDTILKKKNYFFRESDKPELYLENWQSIVHGTLVVPFKVRTRDGRLMGDATLGYYVGKEYTIFSDIEITPLITFGLSTITVPMDENDTETKTGITGAIGLILNHAGNFQIGVVGGIDHLGGSDGDKWKYEDDFWMSFMVGYNFAQ